MWVRPRTHMCREIEAEGGRAATASMWHLGQLPSWVLVSSGRSPAQGWVPAPVCSAVPPASGPVPSARGRFLCEAKPTSATALQPGPRRRASAGGRGASGEPVCALPRPGEGRGGGGLDGSRPGRQDGQHVWGFGGRWLPCRRPRSLPGDGGRERARAGGRAGGGHSLLGLDQKCLCRRSSSCSPPAALSPRRSVRRTEEASVRSSVSPSTRKCTTGGRTAGSRCTPVPSGGRAGLPFHAPGATADGSPPEDTGRDCPRPMGGQTEARGGVCLVEGHEKFGQQCR